MEFLLDIQQPFRYNQAMNREIADALADSMRGFRLPRYSEIPDMGLYLEQAAKYVNRAIRPLGFEDVTGSMVRNYVKLGLIANPVRKQYSAAQLAHLIVLALLKQVTNLENISSLFQLLNGRTDYTVQVAYDYFCDELENVLYFRFGLRDSTAELGVTSSLEKEMLRSTVTAVSNIVYLNCGFRILADSGEPK